MAIEKAKQEVLQFSRQFFDFVASKEKIDTDFILCTRLRNFDSYAELKSGRFRIVVNANQFIVSARLNRKVSVDEYPHIEHDKHIGSYEGCWKKAIAVLISHELAHVKHMMSKDSTDEHGKRWQNIYKRIRKRYVNDIELPCYLYNEKDLTDYWFIESKPVYGGFLYTIWDDNNCDIIGKLYKQNSGPVFIMRGIDIEQTKYTTIKSTIKNIFILDNKKRIL